MTSVSQLPTRRRYHAFDLLRGISLLFMVACHVVQTFQYYMPADVLGKLNWIYVSYATIGPSALMIAMGANLAFSRNHTPRTLAKRGLVLLALDLGLNIVRYLLPGIVYLACGWTEDLSYAVSMLLRSDIYAFAGGFFLLFALFKHLRLSSFAILNLSVLMLAFNAVVEYYHLFSFENPYLSDLFSRFFWVGYNSYFTLFSWTIFPAIGYYFGERFHQLDTPNQQQFARRMLVVCGTLTIAFLAFLANIGRGFSIAILPMNDFKTEPFGVILMILLAGFCLSFLHLFVTRFPNLSLFKPFLSLSKRIIPFYLIQWVLIIWISNILLAFNKVSMFSSCLSVYLFALIIILASSWLSLLVLKRRPARK